MSDQAAGRDQAKPWIAFTVPLIPPSVNHYKKPNGRGGFVVSGEAKAFKDAVCIFARQRGPEVSGDSHGVQLQIFLPAKKRGDVDNFAKVALDGLVAAGVIKSDDSVDDLRISKARDPENPRTEFLVWDYDALPELRSAIVVSGAKFVVRFEYPAAILGGTVDKS